MPYQPLTAKPLTMRKELLLSFVSAGLALIVALGLIRWFAPGLLGLRTDQIVVRAAAELPPYYANVFRRSDFESNEFILQDPLVSVRAHPLLSSGNGLGPHDLLGFRNHGIPNVADVVVIGDSQTYGNNVSLEENWPSRMSAALPGPRRTTYAMATGGWGAVQYLDMAKYAATLRPQVIVVAFYTGNDPAESFKIAYSIDQWSFLKPNPGLSMKDMPAADFPVPDSKRWKVTYADGVTTVFTPELRLASNDPALPAVEAGYGIMREAARLIAESAARQGIKVVFAIIPTKELVYAEKPVPAGIVRPPAYDKLIAEEKRQIERLSEALKKLSGAVYQDLVVPLQTAAKGKRPLYLENENGHPTTFGYEVIGRSIAAVIGPLLRQVPRGPVFAQLDKDSYSLHFITADGSWAVTTPDVLVRNGWSAGSYPTLPERDVAALPALGMLESAAPERFCPAALK